MSDLFADRLLNAIAAKGSPICVGIDPMYEMLPDDIAGPGNGRNANDAEGCVDAIFAFTTQILRMVAPLVPCVKFQSAYFEKYLWEGVEAYYSLIQEAKELGLIVIGDVKRGDIGSTSAAYAAAHLSDPPFDEHEDIRAPDAITINPFLGMDSIEPFVKTAQGRWQGAVCSRPHEQPRLRRFAGRKDRGWPDIFRASGRQTPADRRERRTRRRERFQLDRRRRRRDANHTMASLRQRLPQSIFLLPGYGTQGATAEMTKAAFINGKGAIVSASRSILYAHREPKYGGMGWKDAVITAVQDMRRDIDSIL